MSYGYVNEVFLFLLLVKKKIVYYLHGNVQFIQWKLKLELELSWKL